jgi:hypothetical protein
VKGCHGGCTWPFHRDSREEKAKIVGEYVNSEDGFCKLLKTVFRQPRDLPVR